MLFDIVDYFFAALFGGVALMSVLLYFYKKHMSNPLHILSINIWYAFSFTLFSVVFLDNAEIYITELGRSSYDNMTWLIFLVLNWCVLLGYSLVVSVQLKDKAYIIKNRESEAKATFCILTLVLLINGVNLFLSDALPVGDTEVRRFNYWEGYSAFSFLPHIFGKLVFFFPIVTMALLIYYSKIKKNRALTNVLNFYLILYFVYLFLTGQRFNGFILPLLIMYGLFFCYNHFLNLGYSIRRFQLRLIAICSVFLVIGIADILTRDLSQKVGAAGAAIYRVGVLQGSTFWGLYDEYLSSGVNEASFFDILSIGSELINYIVMPLGSAEEYVDAGINLSGNLTGYFLIFFGMGPAFLLSIFYGIVLGVVSRVLLRDALAFRFPELFVISILWLNVIACYSRGSLETIFSLKTIILLSLYFGLSLLRKGMVRASTNC